MGVRETLHLGGGPKPSADPNRPHAFKRLSDNWLGHGVPPMGGAGRGPDPAQVIGAAMQFTGQQCAICRRLPDDPIHDPVQD